MQFFVAPKLQSAAILLQFVDVNVSTRLLRK